MTDVLDITQHGRVTLFTLNRPDKLNAFNPPMSRDMLRITCQPCCMLIGGLL